MEFELYVYDDRDICQDQERMSGTPRQARNRAAVILRDRPAVERVSIHKVRADGTVAPNPCDGWSR